MKSRLLVAVAGLMISSLSFAGSRLDIAQIAEQAGLREREVRMVLGAPVSFAEMRTSYPRAREKMLRTFGAKQVRELAEQYRENTQQRNAG